MQLKIRHTLSTMPLHMQLWIPGTDLNSYATKNTSHIQSFNTSHIEYSMCDSMWTEGSHGSWLRTPEHRLLKIRHTLSSGVRSHEPWLPSVLSMCDVFLGLKEVMVRGFVRPSTAFFSRPTGCRYPYSNRKKEQESERSIRLRRMLWRLPGTEGSHSSWPHTPEQREREVIMS